MAFRSLWAQARGQKGLGRAVTWNLLGFATWIPVIAFFNLYVAELTLIDGASMHPLMNSEKDSTLRRDVVLTWKFRPVMNLERGMVVTMRSPMHPNVVAVKRIVAFEGDVVKTKAPYPVSTVKIPQGHVWVEGDGPPGSSLDSNTYGPISKRLITGKVTHIVYPFSKFGELQWRDHERQLVE